MTATTTIPIVMVADNADPVSVGYVVSLARPGRERHRPDRSFTGGDRQAAGIPEGRRPRHEPSGGPSEPGRPGSGHAPSGDGSGGHRPRIATAGARRAQRGRHRSGLPRRGQRACQGLVVLRDPLTNTHRPKIVALAAQHRLPAIYASDEFVRAGGLMFYGANVEGLYPPGGRLRRADPQGSQACRPACSASHRTGLHRQPQSRTGSGVDHPAVGPRPRRPRFSSSPAVANLLLRGAS